ncbi:MAG: hypothetical protein ACR2H6_14945 [Pyrinomonadaceae bacterium]
MKTNAVGTVTTKAQLMEILKTSPFKIKSIENDGVKIRIYGNAVVVTGRSKSARFGRDNALVSGRSALRGFMQSAKADGKLWRLNRPPILSHELLTA